MRTLTVRTEYLSLLIVAAVLAACASGPKVRVDRDASVNFSSLKTFAWLDRPAAPAPQQTEQPGAAPTTLITRRVRTSIANALQSKGLSLREADPDFRVAYTLNVYERPRTSGMRVGLGAGGGSGHVGGGVGVSVPIGKRTEAVASLTIDLVDAKRNTQIWTGTYEEIVKSIDLDDAEVDKLVATILQKFP